MTDRFDLVIHTLNGSVGESRFGPGENSVQVRAEHSHEFLERLQPRSHGRVHPLELMLLRAPRLPVGPEELKRFL